MPKKKQTSVANIEAAVNTEVSDSNVVFGGPSVVKAKVFRKKQSTSSGLSFAKQPLNQEQQKPKQSETKKVDKQNTLNVPKPQLARNNKNTKLNEKVEHNKTNNKDFIPSHKVGTFGTGNIKRKYRKDKQKLGDVTSVNVDKSSKEHSLFSGSKTVLTNVVVKSGKSLSEKVFAQSGGKFSDLDIHKYLVSNLEKLNFTTLTTVQEKAIPVVLSGKDVLIRSQTGSGKTLVYGIPIIDALVNIKPKLQRKDGVQAIVVVPTRELAMQTHELFNKINTFQWIVSSHLCGGENRKSEKDRLRKGVHILIGTPGRLLDHVLHTTALKIDKVRCLVLDEADLLLDMGFRKDIIGLVEALSKAKEDSQYDPMAILKSGKNKKQFESDESDTNDDEVRKCDEFPLRNVNSSERQTILLSATLTQGVSELADFAMKNHVFVDALETDENVRKTNDLVIPDTVNQEFILTPVKHRLFTLSALIISKIKENSKIFVFMASTQMVDFHYDLFQMCLLKMPVTRGKLKAGNVVLCDAELNDDSEDEEEEIVLDTEIFKLHGSMDQKTRKEVFNGFRAAKNGVLICTDVAARGIDVPSADCIIQYTGPQTDEDYLHRVGRTGRAGQVGYAVLFLTQEEQKYVSSLAEHGVYLKQCKSEKILRHLCDTMQEPDHERAAEALQRRYQSTVSKNPSLHTSACFAYSTWSRFYNTYPAKMRAVFNFKEINLGHYATSFALKDSPSQISRVVRGEVSKAEDVKLNRKLANHEREQDSTAVKNSSSKKLKKNKKNQKRVFSLIASEYDSGLEPVKKKKKKNSS